MKMPDQERNGKLIASKSPKCEICGRRLNADWDEMPDTELYVIGGTYFENAWEIVTYDLKPRWLICIKCYDDKIKPLMEGKLE